VCAWPERADTLDEGLEDAGDKQMGVLERVWRSVSRKEGGGGSSTPASPVRNRSGCGESLVKAGLRVHNRSTHLEVKTQRAHGWDVEDKRPLPRRS
jgi:hypothetical protein